MYIYTYIYIYIYIYIRQKIKKLSSRLLPICQWSHGNLCPFLNEVRLCIAGASEYYTHHSLVP